MILILILKNGFNFATITSYLKKYIFSVENVLHFHFHLKNSLFCDEYIQITFTYLLKKCCFIVLEDHVNQAIRLCMLNGSMEKYSYESLALVYIKFILNKSSTF